MTNTTSFKVVVNHEEQYSIVPVDQKILSFWREVGKTGTEEQCLKYIEEVWTDMTRSDYKRILDQLNLHK